MIRKEEVNKYVFILTNPFGEKSIDNTGLR
jgi:hypothetical protein